jgi:hypothetical protein
MSKESERFDVLSVIHNIATYGFQEKRYAVANCDRIRKT